MNVRQPPDQLYGDLFKAVQSAHLFGDSKTFVDAVARENPGDIVAHFRARQAQPGFDLAGFVEAHFSLPATPVDVTTGPDGLPLEKRIDQLWDLLTREPDDRIENSSLIPLPNRYVVPGGRFREVYYWDSYFTMLGLAASGRTDLIRDMVENFAWLIDQIGFIPNGNRTYYCTRSQPPFFALMVELLAEVSGDQTVPGRYLPQLKREYAFWMSGVETLSPDKPAHRRVVLAPGGVLNRYWDDAASPRQESYAEDVDLAARTSRDEAQLYRDVRAGAESGWDYSPRWFADRRSMETIRTTEVVPVDLNALLYNLEATIAGICEREGDTAGARSFAEHAARRKDMLRRLFFDIETDMFVDLLLPDFSPTGTLSIAAVYPLYFGIASARQAEQVAMCVHEDFLKAGGWVTANYDSGQQWDAPNGWAPMQWMTYRGLRRYGYEHEARAGAKRWIENNIAVYRANGRLLEKYNVVSSGHAGGGGEYEVQDGFGWTNGVLLRLMQELREGGPPA